MGGIEVMATRETAPVESSILVVRGQRVILAADLARIYGVQTRVLNQAVKRNRERFPEEFTFRLTREEAKEIAASRSQSVILKRGENIKYLPYVYDLNGANPSTMLRARPEFYRRNERKIGPVMVIPRRARN
jgi:hypothetical protein